MIKYKYFISFQFQRYEFIVNVFDSIYSSTTTVTINVKNVNDNSPVVGNYKFEDFTEEDPGVIGPIATVSSFIWSVRQVVCQSFVHLFIHLFRYLFFCSFVHSFVCFFLHSFVWSFIHSFIHSFICSFVHSFVQTFIHSLNELYSFSHND